MFIDYGGEYLEVYVLHGLEKMCIWLSIYLNGSVACKKSSS